MKTRTPVQPAASSTPAKRSKVAKVRASDDAGVKASPPQAEPPSRELVRRKPDDQRKETQLHIRVTDTQKEAMARAAAGEGLELSAWVRSTLLKAAGATGG